MTDRQKNLKPQELLWILPNPPDCSQTIIFHLCSGTDHTILVCALLLESMIVTYKNTIFFGRLFFLKKFYFTSLSWQFWGHVKTRKRIQDLVKGCQSFSSASVRLPLQSLGRGLRWEQWDTRGYPGLSNGELNAGNCPALEPGVSL